MTLFFSVLFASLLLTSGTVAGVVNNKRVEALLEDTDLSSAQLDEKMLGEGLSFVDGELTIPEGSLGDRLAWLANSDLLPSIKDKVSSEEELRAGLERLLKLHAKRVLNLDTTAVRAAAERLITKYVVTTMLKTGRNDFNHKEVIALAEQHVREKIVELTEDKSYATKISEDNLALLSNQLTWYVIDFINDAGSPLFGDNFEKQVSKAFYQLIENAASVTDKSEVEPLLERYAQLLPVLLNNFEEAKLQDEYQVIELGFLPAAVAQYINTMPKYEDKLDNRSAQDEPKIIFLEGVFHHLAHGLLKKSNGSQLLAQAIKKALTAAGLFVHQNDFVIVSSGLCLALFRRYAQKGVHFPSHDLKDSIKDEIIFTHANALIALSMKDCDDHISKAGLGNSDFRHKESNLIEIADHFGDMLRLPSLKMQAKPLLPSSLTEERLVHESNDELTLFLYQLFMRHKYTTGKTASKEEIDAGMLDLLDSLRNAHLDPSDPLRAGLTDWLLFSELFIIFLNEKVKREVKLTGLGPDYFEGLFKKLSETNIEPFRRFVVDLAFRINPKVSDSNLGEIKTLAGSTISLDSISASFEANRLQNQK